MSAVTIQQMADRVAELMEQRLGARGAGLTQKLRKDGRQLPRKVREAAELLAQAAIQGQNPKMLRRINEEAVAQAYDACVQHLNGVDVWDRRRGVMMGFAGSIVFSLLLLGALVLMVLRWRGFL